MNLDRIAILTVYGLVIVLLVVIISNATHFDYEHLNPTILVAVISGAVTLSIFFLTRSNDKAKLIEQQIREQKLPVYQEFVQVVYNGIIDRSLSEPELVAAFRKLHQKNIVWMSDEAFLAYVDWYKRIRKFEPDPNSIQKTTLEFLKLEELLLVFRKDIGHKNANFSRGSILSLFINDIDDLDLNI